MAGIGSSVGEESWAVRIVFHGLVWITQASRMLFQQTPSLIAELPERLLDPDAFRFSLNERIRCCMEYKPFGHEIALTMSFMRNRDGGFAPAIVASLICLARRVVFIAPVIFPGTLLDD